MSSRFLQLNKSLNFQSLSSMTKARIANFDRLSKIKEKCYFPEIVKKSRQFVSVHTNFGGYRHFKYKGNYQIPYYQFNPI